MLLWRITYTHLMNQNYIVQTMLCKTCRLCLKVWVKLSTVFNQHEIENEND